MKFEIFNRIVSRNESERVFFPGAKFFLYGALGQNPFYGIRRIVSFFLFYSSTGMVSSWLERFHIRVLVCRGRLGSLLISSRIEMLDAALRNRGSDSLFRISMISFTERLIFLGTEESLVMLSRT